MIAPSLAAPQHEPRPLPLFLSLLLQHAKGDAAFIRDVLAGVNAYRTASRAPRPPAMPEIARQGRARLLDYGGNGATVLFVPSLINPPYVLDLSSENSLLRWLARQGVNPVLLDWGDPRESDGALSLGGHVEALLLPLIDRLTALRGAPPILAGYCLGGTLTLCAAQHCPPAGLVLVAAPWDFSGYPPDARANMQGLWDASASGTDLLGLFPMELLQTIFWQLDPQRTLSKYAEFGRLDPESARAREFVTLEDWANDGPPLTREAARELLLDLHVANLSGEGRWHVGGRAMAPETVKCPLLNIQSGVDRIVPAASAPRVGDIRTFGQGHVGMVVGSRARNELWAQLAGWLASLPGPAGQKRRTKRK